MSSRYHNQTKKASLFYQFISLQNSHGNHVDRWQFDFDSWLLPNKTKQPTDSRLWMTVTFQVDTLSNHPLWIRVKKQHIFMIILNKMCRSDAPW